MPNLHSKSLAQIQQMLNGIDLLGSILCVDCYDVSRGVVGSVPEIDDFARDPRLPSVFFYISEQIGFQFLADFHSDPSQLDSNIDFDHTQEGECP